jgi:DNA-binding FadR family transcriptional regulator
VKALVSRNIFEVRRGAGTFIVGERIGVSPDPLGFTFIKDKRKLIEDLMEVRIMIEPRIASFAAASASPEDMQVMRRLHWGNRSAYQRQCRSHSKGHRTTHEDSRE